MQNQMVIKIKKFLMSKMKKFCSLIISTLIISIITPVKVIANKALEGYASAASLPIETPANGGSITIIGKNGSKYTFLTAAHVIGGTTKGETNSVDLSSQTGKEVYAKASIIKDFRSEGIDLAVGTFEYSGKSNLVVLPLLNLAPDAKWEDDPTQYKTISVKCNDQELVRYTCSSVRILPLESGACDWISINGNLGKAPCNSPPTIQQRQQISSGTYERQGGKVNGKEYDIRTATIGEFAIVGYSLPTKAITERVLRVSFAELKNILNRNKNGYNLIYEATSTVPGMSGGPVLAARLCPQIDFSPGGTSNYGSYAGIIGVHGQSEEYGNTGSRSGISLGIPITNSAVVQYLTANAGSLGIPVGRNYELSVKQGCSKSWRFY